MLLSELQKMVEDALEMYGDIPVARTRSLDIDGIIQNDFEKNLIKYSSKDFDVLNGPKNYFTIKTPLYDK